VKFSQLFQKNHSTGLIYLNTEQRKLFLTCDNLVLHVAADTQWPSLITNKIGLFGKRPE